MIIADVEKLAKELMTKFGVPWTFEFDRANRRTGCCKHSTRTISLSYEYALRNDLDNIKNTILHEIAHAIAGPGAGHGPKWKEVCILVGARRERCCSESVDMPKGRWQATCKGCGHKFHKHQAPKSINNRYCRTCGPVKGALTWDFADSD
jgi:predicted SprT family Zn-dependent metalloprotease